MGTMSEAKALKVLRKHNDWRRGGKSREQEPREIGVALDVAVRVLGVHKTAMDVLRHIAGYKRRTSEQRLAKSCVTFLDSLTAAEPNP